VSGLTIRGLSNGVDRGTLHCRAARHRAHLAARSRPPAQEPGDEPGRVDDGGHGREVEGAARADRARPARGRRGRHHGRDARSPRQGRARGAHALADRSPREARDAHAAGRGALCARAQRRGRGAPSRARRHRPEAACAGHRAAGADPGRGGGAAVSEGADLRPLNRTMITLSVMLATIIQALDTTIANVALPHMPGSLSAAQDQITWVLTSYIVAAAIATPLTGWLVDRYTQKRVLLVSVAGFTVASALCGLAGSLEQIVGARLLQGLFGAALVPLSQAVMLEITPAAKRGSAMAIWGVGVMVGPILGPSLGGWLTDSYDWRWVFFINLPIGALAFWGIWRYIRQSVAARGMRFDVFGFASLGLAIGALQMLLDRGQENDWFASTETWVECIAFVISFACFAAHTAFTPAGQSFLNYRLLKNRNYVTGLLFIFIVGLVLYATRALTPPMLQSLMDYPVSTVGLVTAPSGVGTMLAMLVVGQLVGRWDLRLLLLGGFALTAFSLWQMSGYTLVLS